MKRAGGLVNVLISLLVLLPAASQADLVQYGAGNITDSDPVDAIPGDAELVVEIGAGGQEQVLSVLRPEDSRTGVRAAVHFRRSALRSMADLRDRNGGGHGGGGFGMAATPIGLADSSGIQVRGWVADGSASYRSSGVAPTSVGILLGLLGLGVMGLKLRKFA